MQIVNEGKEEKNLKDHNDSCVSLQAWFHNCIYGNEVLDVKIRLKKMISTEDLRNYEQSYRYVFHQKQAIFL